MTPFLVFELHGAMASWGDIAVGETRPTASHPSRSALLGLLGAARGVRRDDYPARQALARAVGCAVRVDESGDLLQDFHTAQVPPTQRNQLLRSRREELAWPKLGTILSRRDYHCGVHYTVVVWQREDTGVTLEALAEALRRPRFVLYLGRKACPPTAPLRPKLVEATTLVGALEAWDAATVSWSGSSSAERRLRLYWEPLPQGVEPGVDRVEHVYTRRDEPVIAPGWQFMVREENQGRVSVARRGEEG